MTMSKFINDDVGTYLLAGIAAITAAIDRDKNNQETGRRAILHMAGGGMHSTNIDFKQALAAWREALEPKASDAPAPPSA